MNSIKLPPSKLSVAIRVGTDFLSTEQICQPKTTFELILANFNRTSIGAGGQS